MKVCWLIAHEKLESNPAEPKLTEAVKNAGIDLITARYSREANFQRSYVYDVPDYDIVIAHGPIQFIKQLQLEIPKKLYIFGFKKDTDFSHYSSYIKQPLLNDDYVILPYSRIDRHLFHTYSGFDYCNKLNFFVRPNSGFKTFTGFTFNYSKVVDTLLDHKQCQHISNHELCILTSQKPIKAEFRFVICNREVVASSQYVWDDRKDVRIDVHQNALKLAKDVAQDDWQLDLAYVVDICLTPDDEAYIIEFNSFSSAGLYNCDRDAIVQKITRAAIDEYNG